MIKKIALILILIVTMFMISSCGVRNNNPPETSVAKDSPAPCTNIPLEPQITDVSNDDNDLNPIVYLIRTSISEFGAIVLGGSYNGVLFTYNDIIRGKVGDGKITNLYGEEFKCYGEDGFINSVRRKNSILSDSDREYGFIYLDNFETESYQPIIGIDCDWDVLPRTPVQITSDEMLLDYDGDGTEEKIINKYGDKNVVEGDDVRDVDICIIRKGEVISILHFSLYNNDGFYYYFLDLNGDNVLEMVYLYYDNYGYLFEVYEIKNKEFIKVYEYLEGGG